MGVFNVKSEMLSEIYSEFFKNILIPRLTLLH